MPDLPGKGKSEWFHCNERYNPSTYNERSILGDVLLPQEMNLIQVSVAEAQCS